MKATWIWEELNKEPAEETEEAAKVNGTILNEVHSSLYSNHEMIFLELFENLIMAVNFFSFVF